MGLLTRLKTAGVDYLLHDERGNATVETVLWLPIYVLFFSLIVDASMMFNAQSHLTRLAQDASRRYSIGLFPNDAAAEDYIKARIGNAKDAPRTEVHVTVADSIISTEIIVDAGLYMAVGFFDVLDHIQLHVRSQHFKEI